MQNAESEKQHRFLLHIIILLIGIVAVTLAFVVSREGSYTLLIRTVLLSLGTALAVSSSVAILYQKLQLSELQQVELRILKRLTVHQDATKAGIVAVYRNRSAIPNPDWTDFIAEARQVVWIYGMAVGGFAKDEKVPDVLRNLAQMGGEVRILLLAPESQLAGQIDKEEGGDGSGLPGRIYRSRAKFTTMQNQNEATKTHVKIATCDCYPQVSIIRSDDQMLVTPYVRFLEGDMCPTFRLQRVRDGIFDFYVKHFERLWESCQ